MTSCELLWIMYLWKVEYNWSAIRRSKWRVVNCFELCIFEKLNTTIVTKSHLMLQLWIALNYVSLKSWIQLTLKFCCLLRRCELLWIMYLWKVEYNGFWWLAKLTWLWIALNYVSLKSWIQLLTYSLLQFKSCELLWIMYLWKVEYNNKALAILSLVVVNCFELCIFEKLNTTIQSSKKARQLLWIALNYVSLKSWIQLSPWLGLA